VLISLDAYFLFFIFYIFIFFHFLFYPVFPSFFVLTDLARPILPIYLHTHVHTYTGEGVRKALDSSTRARSIWRGTQLSLFCCSGMGVRIIWDICSGKKSWVCHDQRNGTDGVDCRFIIFGYICHAGLFFGGRGKGYVGMTLSR